MKHIRTFIVMIGIIAGFYSTTVANVAVFNVKNYGAKGDGVTNDYEAILSAINALNANKTGKIIFPAGVYYIANYHSANSNYQNLVFSNLNNVTVEGESAIIRFNANFVRKEDKRNGRFNYSDNSHLTVSFTNVNNLVIKGLELDGGAYNTKRQGTIAEKQGRILSFLNCENVTMQNVKVHHALTDGIYITGTSKNFNFNNVVAENNARQGMSIVQLVGGNFTNCTFAKSGQTGQYGGHSPMAGVDIEPTLKDPGVKNITFDRCNFIDNNGSQIVITSPDKTENVVIMNSIIDAQDSKFGYPLILSGNNIVVKNNTINTGIGNIHPLWGKFKNSKVIIENNDIKSESRGFIVSDKSGTNKVYIRGNTIQYTGNKSLTSFFPYITNAEEFTNNRVIIPKKYLKAKGSSSLLNNIKINTNNVFDQK